MKTNTPTTCPARRPDPTGARAALGISPQALVAVIKRNIARRPLWPVKVIENFFDLTGEQVVARIENGEFEYAFNITTEKRRREPRILALCVLEKTMSPFKEARATHNLKFPQVIDLILPQRDVRSTELRRIFCCSSGHVYQLARYFTVTKKPTARDGPKSYTIFSRASVAKFLERRLIT